MLGEKKTLDTKLVKHIAKTYDMSHMHAAIFTRRGIVESEDIKFFLEDDISYMHSPFLFKDMAPAIQRIRSAKEENEKVLVFGDRDVDGITSTAIIVQSLRELDIDVLWQVPLDESGYGFTVDDVAAAAEKKVTLIITIDCGISNYQEITYAKKIGIDVLVFDHHNVGASVPPAYAVVNPKIESQGYPYKDICAATIALKLRMALAFSSTQFFNHTHCLMNIVPLSDAFRFEIMAVRNFVPLWKKDITITSDTKDAMSHTLFDTLQEMPITVYNAKQQQSLMRKALGTSTVDLYCEDIQPIVEKHIPSLKDKSLLYIYNNSKFARYSNDPESAMREIDMLMRVYSVMGVREIPSYVSSCMDVIDLVALATVADIMPLINENRIIMHMGLKKLSQHPRLGIKMLLEESGFIKNDGNKKEINSQDISWNITPIINASGRMGKADKGVKLLLESNEEQAREYAREIVALNKERKNSMNALKKELQTQMKEHIEKNDTFVCVYNENIPHTFTGTIAGQYARKYKIPCMILTTRDTHIISGSIRCDKRFHATDFLGILQEYFIDFGGHQAAAGFSLEKEKLSHFLQDAAKAFKEHLQNYDTRSEFEDEEYAIDLEIPENIFSPDELKSICNNFKPYGEAWKPITILFSRVCVHTCEFVGAHAEHAKFIVTIGAYKVPCLLWNYAQVLCDITQESLAKCSVISFVAQPKINEYMGVEQISLIIQKIQIL